MRVTLRVLAGPYHGQEFTFDQHDTFLIGRSESAHLYLPEDKFFSRNHCLLEIAPPRCFLRDLGSTNGTYVNGRRVQSAYLKAGDRIQGGETVLTVDSVLDGGNEIPSQTSVAPSDSEVTVQCLNCGILSKTERL